MAVEQVEINERPYWFTSGELVLAQQPLGRVSLLSTVELSVGPELRVEADRFQVDPDLVAAHNQRVEADYGDQASTIQVVSGNRLVFDDKYKIDHRVATPITLLNLLTNYPDLAFSRRSLRPLIPRVHERIEDIARRFSEPKPLIQETPFQGQRYIGLAEGIVVVPQETARPKPKLPVMPQIAAEEHYAAANSDRFVRIANLDELNTETLERLADKLDLPLPNQLELRSDASATINGQPYPTSDYAVAVLNKLLASYLVRPVEVSGLIFAPGQTKAQAEQFVRHCANLGWLATEQTGRQLKTTLPPTIISDHRQR